MPAGTRLGRYELIKRFASGGMAELYLARAVGISGFEKFVALKRILPQYAQQEDFVRMFLDEARLTATIQHANVAQVYDIGQCDDGLFFTMEYVHGVDLRTVLHALAKRGEAMPVADALTVVIGAAAGLHAAHDRTSSDGKPLGIIHRDVTPSNVLIAFDGCVKLIDFGIAKAERRTTETRAGTLKGKIAYMSPEQCLGEPLDRRSDVFSLGIVLFETTTGTRLFPAENEYAALRQIVDQDAPRPSTRRPDYPPALEAIVMRALARDRSARYASALELQLDLEELARANALGISTAHLGRWLRALLPERAAEPLIEEHVVALPLSAPKSAPILSPALAPTRALGLAVVPRGTNQTPALAVAAALADPNLADELEPSISIRLESSAGPEPVPASESAVSVVSAQLALLQRQRHGHLAIAVGLAAAISAIVAVLVVLSIRRDPPARPAPPVERAMPVPVAAPATPAPPVAPPVAPVAPAVATPAPAAPALSARPEQARSADSVRPEQARAAGASRGRLTTPADPVRPEQARAAGASRGRLTKAAPKATPKPTAKPPAPKPSKPARAWNPDSALPPM